MKQQTTIDSPQYWSSVGIVSLIFGLIYFVIPLFMGYKVIDSDPSGSLASLLLFFMSICFACLIGAFGGMGSVWHYATYEHPYFQLSKGALIGFLTGAGMVIIKTVLDNSWYLIDPEYIENLREGLIRAIEATEIPEQQKQMQIDTIANQFRSSKGLSSVILSLLLEIPVFGLLNLLTGMLGVKLFTKKKEQF